MAFSIQISTGKATPIYRQIVEQVRHAVASGELKVGDKIPSVRGLAEKLLVNHNTVAKAYGELVREGVVESRHGRGAFIAQPCNLYSAAERKRRLDEVVTALVREGLMLNFSEDDIRKAVEKKFRKFDAGGKSA